MKVSDFMITDVVAVQSSTSVLEMLTKLVEHKIGGVPVVDSNCRLIGMISDGDVIRFLKPNTKRVYDFFSYVITTDPETLESTIATKLQTEVNQIMHKKNLYSVTPDDPLEKAIDILSHHHFKKIPVVNGNGQLVGVISRGDVIRQLSKMFILKQR